MTSIIKREGIDSIGRPLTNEEVDTNFISLDLDKLQRDGQIAMTGPLRTPGLRSTSQLNGLTVVNQAGQTVATFGKNNSRDLIIEGSLTLAGTGQGGLNLNGGDLETRNLTITGRIIYDELNGQYNVTNVGDVYYGVGSPDLLDSNKLIIQVDTIVKLVDRVGNFAVGETVIGQTSGATGILTRVLGDALYIRLQNLNMAFSPREFLFQDLTGGSVQGVVSQIINTSKLNTNHKIKVFGANAVGATVVDPTATALSLTKIGSLPGTEYTYRYWITQFRYSDGQISASRLVGSAPAPGPTSVVHGEVSEFNNDNYIKLTLARSSIEYGIAIYRSKNSAQPFQAQLIDILGPAELGTQTNNILYADFGTFSNTSWSTRDESGAFIVDSGIVHIPLIPNTIARAGWMTLTVDQVLDSSRIKLSQQVQLNSDSIIEFVHDNTDGLQEAIDNSRDLSLRNLILPNGVYYTSRLSIPNDFNLLGSGKLTVLKQIPWNFNYYNDAVTPTNKGNILYPQTPNNVNGIYVTNLQIDGNFTNNLKFSEVESNYVCSFKDGHNINFENVFINKVVGGGLYLYNSDLVRILNSEIINGSTSYRGTDLSPIYASQATRFTITGNVCENFISPLDVSVTNTGVVVGNTIRNCGSGLLVYGSGSLLSSPNLIMGPDNEYIPTPDTQDSDFNSVNILINPGVDYIAPVFLYLSRGTPVDLGDVDNLDSLNNPIPGTATQISSDIFVLTKLNNTEIVKVGPGLEAFDYSNNLSGQPIINIITSNTGDFGRNNGYFQFRVNASNATELPSLSTLINTHTNLVPGETIVGLAYRIKATQYTYTEVGERILISSGVYSTSGGDRFYTITLKNPEDYTVFSVGEVVKLFGHQTTPLITGIECTVNATIENGLFRQIRIQLPVGAPTPSNGGETGYVTIRNTIIIAKGRIL